MSDDNNYDPYLRDVFNTLELFQFRTGVRDIPEMFQRIIALEAKFVTLNNKLISTLSELKGQDRSELVKEFHRNHARDLSDAFSEFLSKRDEIG